MKLLENATRGLNKHSKSQERGFNAPAIIQFLALFLGSIDRLSVKNFCLNVEKLCT
jgi:hypothetical protein